jgi:hypothetical protein
MWEKGKKRVRGENVRCKGEKGDNYQMPVNLYIYIYIYIHFTIECLLIIKMFYKIDCT